MSRSTCSGVNANFRHDFLCALSAVSWHFPLYLRKFNECFILDASFCCEFPFFSGVDCGNYEQRCRLS